MLYTLLKEIAEKSSDKIAINSMSYSELLAEISNRDYSKICNSEGVNILLDVLKAASIDKPIVVLPKDNKDSVIIPDILPDKFAVILYSSGSTGKRKPIILPESMIVANAKNVIKLNNITNTDKILTVCSLNHTAGLTCQTMAGLLAGATLVIEPFNAFTLLRLLSENEITITHVVPMMTELLMKVKNRPNFPKLRLVWSGSDCVPKKHAEYWLSDHTEFMTVYGMTEAGPPAIAHIFKNNDDLSVLDTGIIAGSQVMCESKIVDNELWLKGDIINTDDWLQTGDCFKIENGFYYYTGRVSTGGKIVPKGQHI